MGLWDATKKYVSTKADEAAVAGGDLYGGLTDATGDFIEDAAEFSHDAQNDFREYVTDPVMNEVEDIQSWSHELQEDAKDGLNWTAEKAAEGFIDNWAVDFLMNPEDGVFGSVTEKIQEGWDAAEDGNYKEAAIKTGQAFLDAVDEVALAGLGELGYDWIMNSTNDMESTGEASYEIRGNLIKIRYQGQDMIFKAENEQIMADFVGQLAALAEGESADASEWPTTAAAVEAPSPISESNVAEAKGQGMTGTDSYRDYSNIKTGTGGDGSKYIIGGL